MNRLLLNTAALIRLEAQVRLNGTFQHRLTGENPHRSVLATVVIEQGVQFLRLEVAHNGSRYSVALDKTRRGNALRVARFIEATVNGDAEYIPDGLASDTEIVLQQAIRNGQGTYVLPIDDLEPELRISRTTRGGSLVQVRLGTANAGFTLPADSQRAYTLLANHLHRFLQDYRAAFSAAA